MNTTLRIARLELSTLFYSPVAWLVLIIFTVQSGLTFTEMLERYDHYLKMGWHQGSLTSAIFSGPVSFFASVKGDLYLYLPLLTMGLISREVSSGSIKLLYSSPVTITSVVLGKMLAMMGYGLLLMAILVLFVFAGSCSIPFIDWPLVVTGITAVYLLVCAYAAIGLFMSCLTSYQVVAAISTLVVFAALNFIGTVGQTVPVLRDLTFFLSISGRADTMIGGLISTKDVLYFLIVTGMFVGLTICKLQEGLSSHSIAAKAGRYLVLILTALLLGYVSSRPSLIMYKDVTVDNNQTLTPNSIEVVQKIKKPLTITTYVNLFDPMREYLGLMPEDINKDRARFEEYTRFLPGMQFKYVYYYDTTDNEALFQQYPGLLLPDIASQLAEVTGNDPALFLSPAQIKKQIDLSSEGNRCVRVLSCGDRRVFLRFFRPFPYLPGEAEITPALKDLVTTPPRILFLTGHEERSIYRSGDRDYQLATTQLTSRYALVNLGFAVEPFSLDKVQVPLDIAALVIADPKQAFTSEEITAIKQYVAVGGNLLVAAEPGRQFITNPLLSFLGVQAKEEVIQQDSSDNDADFIVAHFGDHPGGGFEKLKGRKDAVTMPGVAALDYSAGSGFRADTLLAFRPAGEMRPPFPLAFSLHRNKGGKEQRVIVLGDADLLSNAELTRRNRTTANFAFSTELYRWFAHGAFPVDTTRPPARDVQLVITRRGINGWRLFFLGVLPGLLLLVGAVILIRRKRK